jgi:Xaa-Pro aminopeptidase
LRYEPPGRNRRLFTFATLLITAGKSHLMVDREKMRQAGLDRIERVRAALAQNELAGVVCTLPSDVLMLSGYRPVVGMSAAVVSRVGGLLLIVPEDESELAAMSWADEIRT